MYFFSFSEFTTCGITDVCPVPSGFVICTYLSWFVDEETAEESEGSWKESEENCDVLNKWGQRV